MSPVKLLQLDTRGSLKAMVGEEAHEPAASLIDCDRRAAVYPVKRRCP